MGRGMNAIDSFAAAHHLLKNMIALTDINNSRKFGDETDSRKLAAI